MLSPKSVPKWFRMEPLVPWHYLAGYRAGTHFVAITHRVNSSWILEQEKNGNHLKWMSLVAKFNCSYHYFLNQKAIMIQDGLWSHWVCDIPPPNIIGMRPRFWHLSALWSLSVVSDMNTGKTFGITMLPFLVNIGSTPVWFLGHNCAEASKIITILFTQSSVGFLKCIQEKKFTLSNNNFFFFQLHMYIY